MGTKTELHFKLLVEEVNAILQALGGRPYAEVQALIEKIKKHGETQIAEAAATASAASTSEAATPAEPDTAAPLTE